MSDRPFLNFSDDDLDELEAAWQARTEAARNEFESLRDAFERFENFPKLDRLERLIVAIENESRARCVSTP